MADRRIIAENRKARHAYEIVERWEAGIVLNGAEVKSARAGKVSLDQSHARHEKSEIYLLNAFIAPYAPATHIRYYPRRKRKLLLHRREIARLIGLLEKSGMTLIPMSLYFSAAGLAKLEIGLARGRKKADKRKEARDREWERRKERLLRREIKT